MQINLLISITEVNYNKMPFRNLILIELYLSQVEVKASLK